MHLLGRIAARQPHQAESGNKGHDVVPAVYQAGPAHGLLIHGFIVGRGAPHRFGDAVGDVLPVNKHGIPLEKIHQSQLPQGFGHIFDGADDVFHGGNQAARLRAHGGQLFIAGAVFAGGKHRNQNRADGADRAHIKRAEHPIRNARLGGAADKLLKHIKRHIGQRDAQPGKHALHQKAGGLLALGQGVGDKGAVRLHGGVVADIKHPQQQHGHPQGGNVRVEKQAQAATDGAD